MKFAVVLLVFALCGTFAEPAFDPMGMATDVAQGGINLAGNIIHGIFGGHGGQGGVQTGGGAKGSGGANAGGDGGVNISVGVNADANAQIQLIISLIKKIQQAIASKNLAQIAGYITQIIQQVWYSELFRFEK